MKRHICLLSTIGLMVSLTAQANWNGSAPWNNANWPQWTPMYWMDEMSDRMDCCNDPWQDGNWNNWPGAPWSGANNNQYHQPAPQPHPYLQPPQYAPNMGYPPANYAPDWIPQPYGIAPSHPTMTPQPMPQMAPTPRWH